MNYNDIRPYNDAEIQDAVRRILKNPSVYVISKYLWPNRPFWELASMMKKVRSVDDFQIGVMYDVVEAIERKTTDGVTADMHFAPADRKFLAVSNHRDIVLDPAFIQRSLVDAGISTTRVCAGNNLLANQLIIDLMKVNKMVIVKRGLKARELLEVSTQLSSYIRESITSSESSVWIAQRGGRAKTGQDLTETSVLKMFDLSGESTFADNFSELNILPLSISYEYESCDALKAREVLISRTRAGHYVKKKGEDTNSILTGIRQKKGRVHIQTAEPVTRQELEAISELPRVERYNRLAELIDARIISSYKLFKTNYIGYDLMCGSSKYLGTEYSQSDLNDFKCYADKKLKEVSKGLDENELRQIFYEIYGNPVKSKFN